MTPNEVQFWVMQVAEGNRSKAARLLGCSPSLVSSWCLGSRIVQPIWEEKMLKVAQKEIRRISGELRAKRQALQNLTNQDGEGM